MSWLFLLELPPKFTQEEVGEFCIVWKFSLLFMFVCLILMINWLTILSDLGLNYSRKRVLDLISDLNSKAPIKL